MIRRGTLYERAPESVVPSCYSDVTMELVKNLSCSDAVAPNRCGMARTKNAPAFRL